VAVGVLVGVGVELGVLGGIELLVGVAVGVGVALVGVGVIKAAACQVPDPLQKPTYGES
jgi:hypothetical protein